MCTYKYQSKLSCRDSVLNTMKSSCSVYKMFVKRYCPTIHVKKTGLITHPYNFRPGEAETGASLAFAGQLA